MNLVVPDMDHLNRVHFAGNYRCILEWDTCLRALNAGLEDIALSYETIYADIHSLVLENGGFQICLIDQWHFSPSFHVALSKYFEMLIEHKMDLFRMEPCHYSCKYILNKDPDDEEIVIFGTGRVSREWIKKHPKVKIEAVIDDTDRKESFQSIPVINVPDASKMRSGVVLIAVEESERESVEVSLLREIPDQKILLYPEELEQSFYKSFKGYL